MPDLNDFHAFQSTTGGESSGGGSIGCLSPTMIGIIAVIFVLYLIGKIFG